MGRPLLALFVLFTGCNAGFRAAPRAVQIAGLFGHNCAVFDDGRVGCWGGDEAGQLGDGVMRTSMEDDFDPKTWTVFGPGVMVRGLTGAVEVAVGVEHSCARTRDGALYCWGGNRYGELGDGTTTTRLSPVRILDHVVGLAAGLYHTCAIIEGGGVRCWGIDTLHDDQPVLTPTAVQGVGGAEQLSADASTTCARLHDRSVSCWPTHYESDGPSEEPQPHATTAPIAFEVDSVLATTGGGCALDLSAGVTCWGHGFPAGPFQVALPPVTALASTAARMCGLATSGDPWCWGYDTQPPLLMQHDAHAVALAVAEVTLCLIRDDGTIGCISDAYAHDITFPSL